MQNWTGRKRSPRLDILCHRPGAFEFYSFSNSLRIQMASVHENASRIRGPPFRTTISTYSSLPLLQSVSVDFRKLTHCPSVFGFPKVPENVVNLGRRCGNDSENYQRKRAGRRRVRRNRMEMTARCKPTPTTIIIIIARVDVPREKARGTRKCQTIRQKKNAY